MLWYNDINEIDPVIGDNEREPEEDLQMYSFLLVDDTIKEGMENEEGRSNA